MGENPHSAGLELAKELDVSAMSSSRAILRINSTYKFNRLVPHELTQANKDRHVQAALICSNIKARATFWTGSSLVMKSGFTSTTQAEMGVGMCSVSLSVPSQSAI